MGSTLSVASTITASSGLVAAGLINGQAGVNTDTITTTSNPLTLAPTANQINLGIMSSTITVTRPTQTAVATPGTSTFIVGQQATSGAGGNLFSSMSLYVYGVLTFDFLVLSGCWTVARVLQLVVNCCLVHCPRHPSPLATHLAPLRSPLLLFWYRTL